MLHFPSDDSLSSVAGFLPIRARAWSRASSCTSRGTFRQGILEQHFGVNRNQKTAAEFRVKAWKVAKDKARELGWIV
jgi:hypothetical protein